MPDTDPTPTAPGGGLVPAPLSIDGPYRSAVRLGEETALAAAPGTEDTARWLRTTLGAAFGLPLPPGSDGATDTLVLTLDPALPAEGYRLEAVTGWGVRITGGSPAGVFWGAQTLRQLLGPDAFRRAPLAPGRAPGRAAAAPSRTPPASAGAACMLDVARHFMPKDGVLRYLDLIAAHKLNVFHFHLTDDQGWRIEIERLPAADRDRRLAGAHQIRPPGLPAVGREAARRLLHPGRHPRDRRLRRRAAYHRRPRDRHPRPLAGRHRRVSGTRQHRRHRHHLPRRSGTPGASTRTYSPPPTTPCASTRACFEEVLELFPSDVRPHRRRRVPQGPVAGVRHRPGADRGTRPRPTRTSSSPGSSGTSTAGSPTRGRRLIGWDEILEGGLAEGAAVSSWRGYAGGIAAARAGHDVVMCPEQQVYLDHRQHARPRTSRCPSATYAPWRTSTASSPFHRS